MPENIKNVSLVFLGAFILAFLFCLSLWVIHFVVHLTASFKGMLLFSTSAGVVAAIGAILEVYDRR